MNTDIVIALCIALVILLFVYPLYRERAFRVKARQSGVSTLATITRKRDHGGRMGRYFWLLYFYSADGLEYEQQERVPRSGYDAVEVGEQVKIIYLSSNPQDARIVDTRIKG